MEQVYFSAKKLTFIPAAWKDDGTYNEETWPDDAVLLSEDEAVSYWKQTPPDGKQLSSVDGRPCWVDIPPPSHGELVQLAENYRQKLLTHADAVMLDWRTELMLGEISDANRAKLSAWLAYKNKVKAVDVTTNPEHVNWPVPPVV